MSTATYPVPEHPTWDVLDSSKIECFMACPRKFFYLYVLGWKPKTSSIHLVFGDALHQSLEYLLNHGLNTSNYNQACELFDSVYYNSFTDADYELNFPKVPQQAHAILLDYIAEYDSDNNLEVIETEIAGSAPIDVSKTSQKLLHFRLDAIIRKDKHIWIMDHKTTKYLNPRWAMQWELSFQLNFYTHVGYCLYPEDEIRGLLVNGIEVKAPTKKDLALGLINGGKFARIPIIKTYDMMRAWLADANYWYDWIKHEFNNLKQASREDDVLCCFPRNTKSCTDYGGCAFHALCGAWSNPLKRLHAIPPGYEVEFWDPRDYQNTANKVVHLGGSNESGD